MSWIITEALVLWSRASCMNNAHRRAVSRPMAVLVGHSVPLRAWGQPRLSKHQSSCP
jgi:hypothetical protein